jgi:hypothetical protein
MVSATVDLDVLIFKWYSGRIIKHAGESRYNSFQGVVKALFTPAIYAEKDFLRPEPTFVTP